MILWWACDWLWWSCDTRIYLWWSYWLYNCICRWKLYGFVSLFFIFLMMVTLRVYLLKTQFSHNNDYFCVHFWNWNNSIRKIYYHTIGFCSSLVESEVINHSWYHCWTSKVFICYCKDFIMLEDYLENLLESYLDILMYLFLSMMKLAYLDLLMVKC